MPWPGPHVIFVMLTSEVPDEIAMQSSPVSTDRYYFFFFVKKCTISILSKHTRLCILVLKFTKINKQVPVAKVDPVISICCEFDMFIPSVLGLLPGAVTVIWLTVIFVQL